MALSPRPTLGGGGGRQQPAYAAVLSSPLAMAALVTALALAIVFAVFRAELGRPGWKKPFRAAFWLFVATAAALYAHYVFTQKCFQALGGSEGVRSAVAGIYAAPVGPRGYPVAAGDAPPPRSETTPSEPSETGGRETPPPSEGGVQDVGLLSRRAPYLQKR